MPLRGIADPKGRGSAPARRALRTVKGYRDKVEYIHLNPVRAGLVKGVEDWPWSSARDYSGGVSGAVSPNRVLAIDRILLPADEPTRI